MSSRRDFLKKAALLTSATATFQSLPSSIQAALAIDPEPGSTVYDAEHIVLLMQENRSFDHSFGTLKGVRGFNDPRALRLANNNLVWLQSTAEGQTYAPFRMNIKDSSASWSKDLPHSWENQIAARNQGKYDQWLTAKRSGNKLYKDVPLTLGYYNREDIPFYYAFADAFTIFDQHFCSSLTGTTCNRHYFWTGTCTDPKTGKTNVRNSDIYFNKEADWKTFPERLQEHNISWKVYQNELSYQSELSGEASSWLSNFTDNNLEWYTQYQVRFSKGAYLYYSQRVTELPDEIAQLKAEIQALKAKDSQKQKAALANKEKQLQRYTQDLATYNPQTFQQLSPFQQELHRRAFQTNDGDPDIYNLASHSFFDGDTERQINLPKGDILYQFRKDVEQGTLPTVSWLVAPQNFSDHPSAPYYGAWYVSEVLDILTKNPEVWKKTVFILNYDENDGYFDHIPPFTAPHPKDSKSGICSESLDYSSEYTSLEEELSKPDLKPEYATEGPIGLGYRVPLIIASPWTKGGWVNSEVCDITSTIQFIEHFLEKKTGQKIREENISSWRRAITSDLSSAFRPASKIERNFPSPIARNELIESIYNSQFKAIPNQFKAFSDAEINAINTDTIQVNSWMPKQENGIKDSHALPYEIYVDAHLTADQQVQIQMESATNLFGERTAGVPFNIYRTGADLKSWSFAVAAGDRISYHWPLADFSHEHCALACYGPNGFYRLIQGKADDFKLQDQLRYEDARTGNLVLKLKNTSDQTYSIQIKDHAYGLKEVEKSLPAGKEITVTIPASKSYNWYDFSVYIQGNNSYERRYAGRVETGQHLKSDPFMGRVSSAAI